MAYFGATVYQRLQTADCTLLNRFLKPRKEEMDAAVCQCYRTAADIPLHSCCAAVGQCLRTAAVNSFCHSQDFFQRFHDGS